jgi:hypothetical protein
MKTLEGHSGPPGVQRGVTLRTVIPPMGTRFAAISFSPFTCRKDNKIRLDTPGYFW